jgi:NADH-quinone oxidoreductase subunit J
MELILFIIVALAAAASALMVIVGKNSVYSTLFLVTTFFCLAVLYVMLGAPFIAALQVIVYAGAIMVLFLFVVMLLNLREAQSWDVTSLMRRGMGFLIAAGLLLIAIATFRGMSGSAAPSNDIGSVDSIGSALFSAYLLPFEIVSVLLLIAIVGVVSILKRENPTATPATTKPGDAR